VTVIICRLQKGFIKETLMPQLHLIRVAAQPTFPSRGRQIGFLWQNQFISDFLSKNQYNMQMFTKICINLRDYII